MRVVLRGFSLVELMVVMAILGVLAVAAYPVAELTVQRDRERELKRALWEIRDAIDAYKRASDAGAIPKLSNQTGYPPSLLALTVGVPDARAGGQMLYFLRGTACRSELGTAQLRIVARPAQGRG